jgi:RNA polymerase sigma-70 factor, ECF subfamily
MATPVPEPEGLLGRVRQGDGSALGALWDVYRPRLKRMVQLRLDSRLVARVDDSDVLQETFLDAQRQLQAYLREPKTAFYVWLRRLAAERLANIHRQHLGAECRTVRREVSMPEDSSLLLARQLISGTSTPSQRQRQEDLAQRMQRAIKRLPPDDREIILMRHFEEMPNGEVAEALGLSDSAATMRYGRALKRLRQLLATDSSR